MKNTVYNIPYLNKKKEEEYVIKPEDMGRLVRYLKFKVLNGNWRTPSELIGIHQRTEDLLYILGKDKFTELLLKSITLNSKPKVFEWPVPGRAPHIDFENQEDGVICSIQMDESRNLIVKMFLM